ncbi:MAG: hypothetical protein GF364_16700, partial [Candidatus Lokiarchaeota archaeon]|nr:hypothetical protein [Candidatus Lokiarchaeota archaeon]
MILLRRMEALIENQDLADFAVKYGQDKNVDYIEARLLDCYDETYVTRNGMFVSVQGKDTKGIGIRVLKDGGMGFGSTQIIKKEQIKTIIDKIIKMAKNSNRKTPIEFSEE